MGKAKVKKPGRPREYTPEELAKAVAKYFASITRRVPVTEEVATDKRDAYGHVVYEKQPVCNALGKELYREEFLVPPTVLGMCLYLDIHRDTWNSYCKDPEYSDTATYVRGRMQCWREEQLLTRKDIAGIKFDLENNYGYREKQQIHVGGNLEELLKELGDEGGQAF